MSNKWYGKFRAQVVNIDDPDNKGRIKVMCPKVTGKSISAWAAPCFPFAASDAGLICIPNVGDTVWVEFEEGDATKPIWVGNWLAKGEMPSEVDPLSKIRIFKSETGHKIILSDDSQAPGITIEDSAGSKIFFNSLTGDIEITAARDILITAVRDIIEESGRYVNVTAGESWSHSPA